MKQLINLLLKAYPDYFVQSEFSDFSKTIKLQYEFIFGSSYGGDVDEQLANKDNIAEAAFYISKELKSDLESPIQLVEIKTIVGINIFNEHDCHFVAIVNDPVFKPDPDKHILGQI